MKMNIFLSSNHIILKVLVQILIFSIFLLGNCYQGLVTSFMLKPIQQKLFKSTDELFESYYKIDFKQSMIDALRENFKFKNVMNGNRIHELSSNPFESFTENIRTNTATAESCKYYKDQISKTQNHKSFLGMYQIQEVAMGNQ